MNRFLAVFLALALLGSPAVAATKIPGPPQTFTDWTRVGAGVGRCDDGRGILIKQYAKVQTFENVGAVIFEDAIGEFVWIYYTDKDEDVDAQWVAWFDGTNYWMGPLDEIKSLFPNPCDIPRPAPAREGL